MKSNLLLYDLQNNKSIWIENVPIHSQVKCKIVLQEMERRWQHLTVHKFQIENLMWGERYFSLGDVGKSKQDLTVRMPAAILRAAKANLENFMVIWGTCLYCDVNKEREDDEASQNTKHQKMENCGRTRAPGAQKERACNEVPTMAMDFITETGRLSPAKSRRID